jgi:phosphatidylethanolamine/phosphatidyl-N-methylethanolamine N-methyltransferase
MSQSALSQDRYRGLDRAKRDQDSPLSFLAAFAREPLAVGSLWPSSKALSQVVADSCEIKPGTTVVELGPGTGAFTGMILNRLNGNGRFLAVEISETNVKVLQRRYPRCKVVHDSAVNLPSHLGGRLADCIVSGLAWGNMLPRTQNELLQAILKSLTPRGQFVAFAYAHAAWFPTSLQFRRNLHRHFQRVETTPVVWRNLPPAYVFRCRRS